MFSSVKKRIVTLLKKNKYGMKFKTKLLISYFIFIFIPVGLVTLITYVNISKSSAEQIRYSSNQVLNQTSDLLNYKVDNIIYASNQIFFGNELIRTLKRDMNLPVTPESVNDYNNVRSLISNIFKKNDMYNLTLFLNPSIFYSDEQSGLSTYVPVSFSSINKIISEDWYKELDNFIGQAIWLPLSKSLHTQDASVEVISCVRPIKDSENYNEMLGVIKIDILKSQINDIVSKASITENSIAFILNSKGDIIASSNEEQAKQVKSSIKYSPQLTGSKSVWSLNKIGANTSIVGKSNIKNTDWLLVSITPYKDIVSASSHIRNDMLVLIVIIGSIVYILAFLFSDSITRRVLKLAVRMKNIQTGQLPAVMEEQGSDEISILIQSYNYMIGQMNNFSVMQYQLGKDVKSAELKALQAQINPHFLYNTLELINWTALRKNVPEVSEIVQALAKFYKLSLSKGKDIVSIRDEISHIDIYVKLQNLRFKNKVTLLLDIDEDLYNFCILKLILQPIVENSILHGILEKKVTTGIITITGRLNGASILFDIKDDGIGMSEEQTNNLLEFNYTDMKIGQGNGYGIKNVNHRLKLYYGDEYGLSCESKLGQGTTITVKVAAIHNSDQPNV